MGKREDTWKELHFADEDNLRRRCNFWNLFTYLSNYL